MNVESSGVVLGGNGIGRRGLLTNLFGVSLCPKLKEANTMSYKYFLMVIFSMSSFILNAIMNKNRGI